LYCVVIYFSLLSDIVSDVDEIKKSDSKSQPVLDVVARCDHPSVAPPSGAGGCASIIDYSAVVES